MDNKRLIVVMLISLAVLLGWSYFYTFLQRTHPEWFVTPEQPAQTQTAPTTEPSTAPATLPTQRVRVPDTQPTTADLGYAGFDPRGEQTYPLGVTIDSRGASVRSVTLNRFSADERRTEPYVYQQPYEDVYYKALSHAFATQKIHVGGREIDLAQVHWRKVEAADDFALYEIDVLGDEGQQLLTVAKRFQIHPATHPSFGYEIAIEHTVRNHTQDTLPIKLFYSGPVLTIETRTEHAEVVTGYNNEQRVALNHQPVAGVRPDIGWISVLDPQRPLLWTGLTSAYFNAIVLPDIADGRAANISNIYVQAARARDTSTGRDYPAFTFETTRLDVTPQEPLHITAQVFLGPRWREVLNQPYYDRFPRSYDDTLVLSGGVCGWCTWGWLINSLVWLLGVFHWIFGGFAGRGDWGLAIIALVVLVRLILHPVTKKSQISMQKMSKMGPEIERLKKKYGDNKEELNKAMMGFYKEQGITPILGCLPMLLQMPIWIALWTGLQSTFELRLSPFLWGYTWIGDLARPDRLIAFSAPVNLFIFGWRLESINLLPLLLAVVFYLQQKMMPQPVTMTPEQQQQAKMMRWMSLLFPVLLYSGPAGLNLYILTSTALGIWESKRVRDHIKEQEEREKEQRVIVDAKPTRASKRLAHEQQDQKKPGCLTGWLHQLQERAEAMRRDSQKRPRK